jgi:hypothetical protein
MCYGMYNEYLYFFFFANRRAYNIETYPALLLPSIDLQRYLDTAFLIPLQ